MVRVSKAARMSKSSDPLEGNGKSKLVSKGLSGDSVAQTESPCQLPSGKRSSGPVSSFSCRIIGECRERERDATVYLFWPCRIVHGSKALGSSEHAGTTCSHVMSQKPVFEGVLLLHASVGTLIPWTSSWRLLATEA